MKDGASATRATSVYEQLRNDILSGRLSPGEKLGAEVLRNRFGIGGSPIREALNRLLAENFVALEDQKGFRVAPVSEQDLRELVTARGWVDGMALTASIREGGLAWEEALILAFHRLRRSDRRPSVEHLEENKEWERLHRDFHLALIGGCQSRWMIRISSQLFDAAERYRLLGSRFVSERNEFDEHRLIVEACLNRDVETAVQLLESHYGRTFDVIMQHMNAPNPEIEDEPDLKVSLRKSAA
ncbi:MAG: GntR family transcriptional regulator [Janthinobacterium lividum]